MQNLKGHKRSLIFLFLYLNLIKTFLKADIRKTHCFHKMKQDLKGHLMSHNAI